MGSWIVMVLMFCLWFALVVVSCALSSRAPGCGWYSPHPGRKVLNYPVNVLVAAIGIDAFV